MFPHHAQVCKSVTVALVLLYLVSDSGKLNDLIATVTLIYLTDGCIIFSCILAITELIKFCIFIIMLGRSNTLRNEMRTTSECVCPDFGVTYECTVMGTENGFTVWRGSALDCIGNEITLRHRLFTSGEGARGECNSGSVLGRSLRLETGSFYVSQLSIRNSSEVVGGSSY